jgi:hypothetical protein
MQFPRIDPVEELRLRRWARENYLPAAQRRPEWHPVILDEMLARDDELRIARVESARRNDVARTIRPARYFVLHGSHMSLADRQPSSSEQQAR